MQNTMSFFPHHNMHIVIRQVFFVANRIENLKDTLRILQRGSKVDILLWEKKNRMFFFRAIHSSQSIEYHYNQNGLPKFADE